MIEIRVPATSANMGPGFDALGVALSLYAHVRLEMCDSLVISGTEARFCNASNLVYAAYRAALARLDIPGENVRIEIESDIPISRGLGSSAAMYVAGALGAAALHGRELTKQELLEITDALEGHPDNLAPAIWGGFTTALAHEGRPCAVGYPVARGLRFCAFVPDFMTNTHEARAALPKLVSHEDAAFTVAHALALLCALGAGDDDAIRRAMDDRLHEPYRKRLIPAFDALKHAAESADCVAFFISGSGPTCMAIYRDEGFPARAQEAVSSLPGAWRVLPLEIDLEGARIIGDGNRQ